MKLKLSPSKRKSHINQNDGKGASCKRKNKNFKEQDSIQPKKQDSFPEDQLVVPNDSPMPREVPETRDTAHHGVPSIGGFVDEETHSQMKNEKFKSMATSKKI